jgi:ankyrin repeat protein
MHEEGNPYLTALQQILVKLEQSISTIRGRIDKFIDNLPRIKTQIDAINSLNVERDVAFDDTEASLPPRTTAWLRTQYPRQPAVPWSYVTIVRKKPDTNKWIVRDPNRTEDIETAHSGLKTAGSPVWLRVNDSWEEMVIGGESNEEGLWPVRSPGPPNPAGCTFVPYTSLKLHAEDSLKDNTLYTRLKQDSSRISELIANAKQFIEGVKLDYMPKDGVTALLKACEKSSTTLVSALTELGADINLQSTTHLTTPLMNAVKGGNTEVVQLLCSNPGITVDLKDSSDYTALYYAVSTRQAVISQEDIFNIIRILIGAGADPKGRFGTTRKTLLLAAVEYRETPCIEYLLDIPLNPNESDSEGRTPLMIASIRGGTSIIEALLGHGANIDALDALQQNALFYTLHVPLNVAEGRALPAIKYLVEKGIDFRQRNRDGLTIYTWAEANLEINQHRAGYRMDRNILPYLAKLLGCIGGICRAVGIEGLGPNANTRRKRAAERGALAAVAPEALTAVAPVGGSRRKRRTKKRGRSRNRNRNRSRR